MLRRWLTKPDPIGCHIGSGRVRLAQVQAIASGRPRVVSSERPLPDLAETDPAYAAALTGLLREMRRSAPFQGARVVSCLPASAARYMTIRLAPMPPAELAQAAHWKLSAELSAGTETFKSAVLNVATIRDGGKQKTEAVVLCATLEQLDRHVAILSAAGLEHVAIDDSVCAVARCLGTPQLVGGDVSDRRVILDLREDDALLAVAGGPELAFVRPLGLGLSHLTKTLADLLEVAPDDARGLHARAADHPAFAKPDAEEPADWKAAVPFSRVRDAVADASRMYGRELARQVAVSTYYYANASAATAPETGVAVSDRPIDPAVLEALTLQSGIAVSAFEPADTGIWGEIRASGSTADAGSWVTAVGLSLYEHGLPLSKEAA